MKAILKKMVACVCMLSLIMTMFINVQASGTQIALDKKSVMQGVGEESIQIPIIISGNTGILGLKLNISYTEGLTLTAVDKGEGLKTLNLTKPGDFTDNPFNMVWDGADADSTNGVVATLTFTVPKDTVKTYAINVNVEEAIDNDLNPVEISTANGEITVTEKPKENFSGLYLAGASYTYDGTAKSLAVSGVPTGATVTYTSKDFDADGKAIDAGTYNITATVSKDGYNDWSSTKVLTINPKPVTVTGITVENKIYDGTNVATLNGGTISGLVARDKEDQYCDEHSCYRIKYAIPSEGTFADANVDTSKAVTINKITLDGCSAGNYTLAQPTGLKANITKAPLTIKANDVTIKTGAAIPDFDESSYEITSGSLFGNDTITGKLATDCKSTSVANNFNITQGTLSTGNNYNITFVAGKLSVVDKTVQNITVEGIVTAKTYGDDGFKITVTPDRTSNLDNFTITSSDTNVAAIDASGNVTINGAGTTTISVNEAGNSEYAPFEKKWTLTVNKAKVTITADNVTKKIGQNDPALTYKIEGKLFGEDEITGSLIRNSGEIIGKYDILIGSLAINENYDIIFNKGIFEIVEKTPQVITVDDIGVKTYGDASFEVKAYPDEVSKLNTFTYTSSNPAVAEVTSDGIITVKSVGETDITVGQIGNDEYAASEKTVKLTVNPIIISVTAIDLENKTTTFNDILEADSAAVELDFDSIKTIVISSDKTQVEETTTVVTEIKVSNFKLKGEKAKNYTIASDAFLNKTITSTTVSEKLTDDENVTIEAAPVNDKTVIVTDVEVVSDADVKKVTVDVTEIADSKVNTVAIPTAALNSVIAIDSDSSLEITLKDGSDENKTSSIELNAEALTAIRTAGGDTTFTFSVEKQIKEDLETAQIAKVEEVSSKSPVVYSLAIVDGAGNSVASSFGSNGKATVTLFYAKPAGNGNIIVQFMDKLGSLTNIINHKYDATVQTLTVELDHFSEYLIYTEPVVYSGGGGSGAASYTVKFDTNGGNEIASLKSTGKVITEPTSPVKEGYTFDGWYTDSEFKVKYDFSSKVKNSFTLYAKWIKNDTEEKPDETDKSEITDGSLLPFTDVNTNDWYYETVKAIYEMGLMKGFNATTFGPDDEITRGMFVTILYRMENEPESGTANFADVKSSAYYAKAIAWANSNNIVNGVTDSTFAPDDNISREQIGTILFRYVQYKGVDTLTLNENLVQFADKGAISEYAVFALNWAVGKDIISGKGNGILDPIGNATRAEAASMLYRFIVNN